jgi:phosphodiesterase/alkaline phosphatase D-like protein
MNRYVAFVAVLVACALLVGVPSASATQQNQALKIINGPRVEGSGPDWAVIAWTTNTGGSSIVRYGTDRNNLNQTAQAPYADNDSTQHQTHRVRLNHLQPNTTYYFTVDSGQGEGTGTEAKSNVAQFKTSGPQSAKAESLKIIDGPRVEGVGKDWAVIAWTTNTGGSSLVHYGTNRNSLSQTAQTSYSDVENAKYQTHRVRVEHLQPNTTYFFQVDSGQGEGTGTEAKSAVAQFKTKAQ